MYFDWRTGAIRWLKSLAFALKQVFFRLPSITEKKEYRKESAKITLKKMHKRGVYQRLGVTLKHWFTPKSWLTPRENFIFYSFAKSLNLTENWLELCLKSSNLLKLSCVENSTLLELL